MIVASLGLALVLIAAKWGNVSFPESFEASAIKEFAHDLSVVVGADLTFVGGFFLVWAGLLWVLRRTPRLRAATDRFMILLAVFAAWYAVLSHHIFRIQRIPLTIPALYVADDLGDMWSSISRYLTPPVIAQLVLTPLIYAFWIRWARRRVLPRKRVVLPILLVLIAFGSGIWARFEVRGAWGSRHDDRRLADNPHTVFLHSVLQTITGGGAVSFNLDFPPEFLDDFRPGSERQDRGLKASTLARGPKNMIFVVLESVGVQHLSLFGSRYKTTPRLDLEARNALVFSNVYAHITNTANSLVALSLSRYPPGLSWKSPTKEAPGMPGSTLAQVTKEKGYRTAFISSGDNRFSNQDAFLKNRGYDAVMDWRDSGRPQLFTWGVEDSAMIDMIFRWIDEAPDRPFYVMSWTQGTHHPYQIPYERTPIDFFQGEKVHNDWDLGNYLNALHETDLQLKRLFDGLRERGLADSTIVAITGDHGEAFGVPHPNYGHSYHCYEEDVHVPLVLWAPSLFQDAERREVVGGHVDIPPTLADLLGFDAPASWQGRSLFQNPHGRAYFYGALDFRLFGVREGKHKYILNITDGIEELYDLEADPKEANNLASKLPDLSLALRRRLAAWHAHDGGG